jgi:uncharacterized protein
LSAQLEALIQAMSDPSLYSPAPDSVQLIQTHVSVVFIAGDLVYKVKKPVNLGFLDFTTLEKRRFFCSQEVKLNSRFSEGLYLGVVSIYQANYGVNLTGEGEEIEVAVLMRRVPEDRLMTQMLKNESISVESLDALADRIAYFHSQAARGREIAGFGSVEVILQNVRENFDQVRPFVGNTIEEKTFREISERSMGFLNEHKELFQERVRAGFIRDCHGDLHVDHVVMLDRIMLFDCIEFNDRFRYGDTAADLGFLLMDLDFLGYPAFAKRLTERYAHSSGDSEVLTLLPFYESYRAFVRGKVLGFELEEPEIPLEEREKVRATARDYFRLSLSYLEPAPPPALVITVGLVATGKSYLAGLLGKRLGIEPMRSDLLRKEIYGLPVFQHQLDMYGQGIYTPVSTERIYGTLLEKARQALADGHSVILDASFLRHEHRMQARELAREAKAKFKQVECTASEDVVRSRLEQRLTRTDEPSDGRWEIFQQQESAFEPIRPEEKANHQVWDSTRDPNAFLAALVRDLICS